MHDRGAKLIVRLLREAGFEVLYTGCQQTPEEIVNMTIRENIDLLGLSCSSGAHRSLFPAVTKGLKENGAENIKVFGGGSIPSQDFEYLYNNGITAIFPSGSRLTSILDWVKEKAD